MMRRLINNQLGFSLTETLVSLSIFSLITLGMAPLMAGSIRGTALARSYTVGKNFAAESMERVRGFPFFESMKGAATPPRQDVLDFYFPDRQSGASGSGFNATANTYTTICSNTEKLPAASAVQACPAEHPRRFQRDVRRQLREAHRQSSGTSSPSPSSLRRPTTPGRPSRPSHPRANSSSWMSPRSGPSGAPRRTSS